MQKIRINDLARELEVKSKAILDVLPLVGVTEKKTHSSSVEVDEAEKVRAHFRAQADSQSTASKQSRQSRTDNEGIKTKIDLSHISKPGDVLKAITKQQSTTATPPATGTRVAPIAVPPVKTSPVASAPVGTSPGAPPRATVPPPPQAPVLPLTAPAPGESGNKVAAPALTPPPTRPAVSPPPVQGSAQEAPPPMPPLQQSEVGNASRQSLAASTPSQQFSAAGGPLRRMIVPQTGPRPVYKAPLSARPESPIAQRGVQSRPAAGGSQTRPAAGGPQSRPAPGRPIPGQPIFQRPRPGAPSSSRPALRPGERRPRHPTRRTVPTPGTALCAPRRKRRPNEGLCSTAAIARFERTATDHANHNDH
jgi:translation initiation factor IF-2